MKYKTVVITRKGDPSVLKIKEKFLEDPQEHELQIKIMAAGVSSTDVAMRYGFYPFAPKIPFIPGYEIVGEVTALGSAVRRFKVGDKVAALTVHGGYSEYIILKEDDLVAVPHGISNGQAVACILNYCTAYQILHRVLQVDKGDKLLILGASGGVGSAMVDLGKNIGLKMYGTSSSRKHYWLLQNGAVPLDYKSGNLENELMKMEPEGMDYVVDGVGGNSIQMGYRALKRGGKLVEYAYPNFIGMLLGLLKIKWKNLIPDGKNGVFYGISASYQKDRAQILGDLSIIFDLLKSGKINPLVDKQFHLTEAASASRYLESGLAFGKVVLVNEE